jgi:hypothetical protein
MALPSFIPSFLTGFRNPAGSSLQALSDLISSIQSPLTAFAGGGQTGATQINAANVEVATVATAADSVKLPPAVPGMRIAVVNTSANSMQVFGSGTDTINAVAYATGVAQAAGKSAVYFCAASGKWSRVLSA